MSESMRLRFVNQIVGVFMLLIIVALVIFTLYLIRARELFADRVYYHLEVQQDDLDGLREGTEVVILGQQAGNIDRIAFKLGGGNMLDITLKINARFQDQIFTDSMVKLRRKFGVGEPYLEVIRGPLSDKILPPQPRDHQVAQLTLIPDVDQVGEVRTSIANVEREMVPALKTIDTAFRNTDKHIAEVAVPTFQKMGVASDTIDRVLRDVEPKVVAALDSIQRASSQIETSVEHMAGKIDEVAADTGRTQNKIRDTAEQVSQSVVNIETQTVETMAQLERSANDLQQLVNESREVTDVLRREVRDLPGTVDRVNSTFYTADEVVGALKRHWLLRRYIDQSKSTRQNSPAGIR